MSLYRVEQAEGCANSWHVFVNGNPEKMVFANEESANGWALWLALCELQRILEDVSTADDPELLDKVTALLEKLDDRYSDAENVEQDRVQVPNVQIELNLLDRVLQTALADKGIELQYEGMPTRVNEDSSELGW